MRPVKIAVPLGERSYSVYAGEAVIDSLPQYLKNFSARKAYVLVDEKLKLHRERTLKALRSANCKVIQTSVAAGEDLKRLERLNLIYQDMLKNQIDRSSVVVALGGGTVGDVAGFVASTYMRGIKWISLPTSLLAQIDSSVGGKTAVNISGAKNLVGTFHQPSLVICEIGFLKTLSSREIVSGLGEVLKYGLCFDPKFFRFTIENFDQALQIEPRIMTKLIQGCLQRKASVVAKDEFDVTGVREKLNFGHTFGHALESLTRYKKFQHGEAVLWGMRFACALSMVKAHLPLGSWREIDGILKCIPIPKLPRGLKPQSYFSQMSKDKKSVDGRLRFVLLRGIGKTILDRSVTELELLKAYRLMERG